MVILQAFNQKQKDLEAKLQRSDADHGVPASGPHLLTKCPEYLEGHETTTWADEGGLYPILILATY
jgi:hypothetical protein